MNRHHWKLWMIVFLLGCTGNNYKNQKFATIQKDTIYWNEGYHFPTGTFMVVKSKDSIIRIVDFEALLKNPSLRGDTVLYANGFYFITPSKSGFATTRHGIIRDDSCWNYTNGDFAWTESPITSGAKLGTISILDTFTSVGYILKNKYFIRMRIKGVIDTIPKSVLKGVKGGSNFVYGYVFEGDQSEFVGLSGSQPRNKKNNVVGIISSYLVKRNKETGQLITYFVIDTIPPELLR